MHCRRPGGRRRTRDHRQRRLCGGEERPVERAERAGARGHLKLRGQRHRRGGGDNHGPRRPPGHTWAAAALAASFALAVLLTLASVARRVREFGTLKALGWQARRITAQVLAESVTVGIAGTLAGVVLGCAGTALGPALTVSVTEPPASIPPPSNTAWGSHAPLGDDGPVAVPVHFRAPISPGIVALAVALGILGASWPAPGVPGAPPPKPRRRPNQNRLTGPI